MGNLGVLILSPFLPYQTSAQEVAISKINVQYAEEVVKKIRSNKEISPTLIQIDSLPTEIRFSLERGNLTTRIKRGKSGFIGAKKGYELIFIDYLTNNQYGDVDQICIDFQIKDLEIRYREPAFLTFESDLITPANKIYEVLLRYGANRKFRTSSEQEESMARNEFLKTLDSFCVSAFPVIEPYFDFLKEDNKNLQKTYGLRRATNDAVRGVIKAGSELLGSLGNQR